MSRPATTETATELPVVSVIIICYRLGRYLRAAVDSCLAQSYANVETIVVNDGSDDETEEVALQYGDRILYIAKNNGGPSSARNAGIAAASGKYLKFLDADDSLHQDQILRQVKALNGREDLVSFTALRNFRDDNPDEYWDHVPDLTPILPDIFGDHDGCAPHNMLVPTVLVKTAGGFSESVRHIEDWHFTYKLGLLEPGVVIDRTVGGFYRRRSGSISTDRSGSMQSLAKVLLTVHDELRALGRSEWFGSALLAFEMSVYRGLLRHGVNDGDLLQSLAVRIRQLRTTHSRDVEGWRFRCLAASLGYDKAERLRTWTSEALRKRRLDRNSVHS